MTLNSIYIFSHLSAGLDTLNAPWILKPVRGGKETAQSESAKDGRLMRRTLKKASDTLSSLKKED